MKIVKNIQPKIVFFYSRAKSLYVAWACFRNEQYGLCAQLSLCISLDIRTVSSKPMCLMGSKGTYLSKTLTRLGSFTGAGLKAKINGFDTQRLILSTEKFVIEFTICYYTFLICP